MPFISDITEGLGRFIRVLATVHAGFATPDGGASVVLPYQGANSGPAAEGTRLVFVQAATGFNVAVLGPPQGTSGAAATGATTSVRQLATGESRWFLLADQWRLQLINNTGGPATVSWVIVRVD